MRGAAGRARVDVAVDNVGGHNGVQSLLADQRTEDGHISGANFRFRARIARRLFMGIGRHRSVSRKVLTGGFHARSVHAVNKMTSYRQGFVRIVVIRTLANSGADMPNVQHRRKADINIHGDHFAGHQPAGLCGQLTALLHAEQRSEGLRCGKTGKTLTETLHAPAFLVYRHHQMVARSLADLANQLAQLRRIVIVAGKQDQPANQRMRQNLTLFRIQFKTFDIQHYRTHTHLSYPFTFCLTGAIPHPPAQ